MQPQPSLVVPATRRGKQFADAGCVLFFKSYADAKAAHKYVFALARLWQQGVYFRFQAAALHASAPPVLTVQAVPVSNDLSTLRFTRQVYASMLD